VIYIPIAIAVLVVLALIWAVLAYNGLVEFRNRVDSAWSQIEVQLRRRYDLIPNLVETVRGYASHERQTLEAVIAARQAGVEAQTVEQHAQAENQITGALRQLFALSEAYPDLKANQNFLSLQEELTATEGRIAYARQHYNDSVMEYDNKRQTMPTNLIAGMFNFEDRDYFEIDEPEARGPVQVQF